MGMVNLFDVFTHAGMWHKTNITPSPNEKFRLVITGKVVLTLLFIRKFEC